MRAGGGGDGRGRRGPWGAGGGELLEEDDRAGGVTENPSLSQNQLGSVAREWDSRFFPKSTWFQGLVDAGVEATMVGTVAEEEQLGQTGVR
jgi:hypothetical protein